MSANTAQLSGLLDSFADAVADRVLARLPKPTSTPAVQIERSEVTKLLLSDEQTCAALGGICRRTLFDWRRERGLPFLTVGGRNFSRPSDLERWIEKQSATEPARMKIAT